jgi:hypothetical protein
VGCRRWIVKRLLMMAAVVGLVGLAPGTVRAHDAYDDADTHPLELAGYVVHAAGFIAEWMVTRPIHFVVSNPQLQPVFGYRPTDNPYGTYVPYEPEAGDPDFGGGW